MPGSKGLPPGNGVRYHMLKELERLNKAQEHLGAKVDDLAESVRDVRESFREFRGNQIGRSAVMAAIMSLVTALIMFLLNRL